MEFFDMCVNAHYVYNRFIKKTILVDCGKCPSCKQKKAVSRANRIRNHKRSDEICFFLTLTYRNDNVPYVLRSDLANREHFLNVYRDFDFFKGRMKPVDGPVLNVPVEYSEDFDSNKLKGCRHLPHRVTVCLYSDIQKFYKRLRQNLFRHYGISPKFSFFSCSEYGGQSHRAHFHALLFCPSCEFETYRSAIVESWPYCDNSKCSPDEWCQVVRDDPSNYVASYVNCGSSLSRFFTQNVFKPHHSYSKGFGVRSECFSLLKVLEKARNGDLSYNKRVVIDGQPSVRSFPIPKYVINRYFPRFKGDSCLTSDEIHEYLYSLAGLYKFGALLDYSLDDIHKNIVRFRNAFNYYNYVTGRNKHDYINDYLSVWRVYRSNVLKHQYDEIRVPSDYLSFYENVNEFQFGLVRSPSLDSLHFDKSLYEANPNNIKNRVVTTAKLTSVYLKTCKQKDVTNFAMSLQGYDV